jgi:hypothetical protein
MGFAILGLGCTIPLTIGGGEIDSTGGVTTEEDGGDQVESDAGPADSGSVIPDSGVQTDGGECLPSVPIQSSVSSGTASPTNTSFSTCCSLDVREGQCYSVPQGWSCSNFRVCTWNNGGECFSTGHTCGNWTDCCSQVCYKGLCASINYTGAKALQGSTSSCKSLQVACGDYTECCSQNCAFGLCAPAPVPTTCGGFLAQCTNSSDCCSLECDNGNCRDSSLPWYLQTAGSQLNSSVADDPVENGSSMQPRFQLNRVDDPLAPDPTH